MPSLAAIAAPANLLELQYLIRDDVSLLNGAAVSEELLTQIYNAFDPKRPLEPDSPFYVQCHDVRGQENIIREVGRSIIRSDEPTYQLYTGHRGAGKSTELKRLRQYLQAQHLRVVYFEATNDLDDTDVQYTDILLSCTHHLLEELRDEANPRPVVNWLQSRWQELKELALTEVEFESLSLEAQIAMFAKLTAKLNEKNNRQKIREQVNSNSNSLIKALNDFIAEARQNTQTNKLVIIADNLDRIGLIPRDSGKTNHDEIFIEYSSQMRRLDCHVIYTVPISLVYSNRVTQLRDNYGDCHVLPMVMVRRRDGTVTKPGTIHQPGLDKMKELVQKRVEKFTDKELVPDVFESAAMLDSLCLISGGHMRELMQLVQTALNWTDELPIQRQAILRAIAKGREDYRNAVDEVDWAKLAEVSLTKRVPNDADYRELLFNRCVLEYCLVEETEDDFETVRWHDVHPLIQKLEPFVQAVKAREAAAKAQSKAKEGKTDGA
ncbi:MAG: AAA family ATPase [Cyanobacteria bacterium P01_C01_bin.120]